jgi:hypothetical protein
MDCESLTHSCLPWTEEDIASLRRMISSGHKGRKEIAIKLGRSVNAVTTKACELGLSKRSIGSLAVRDADGPFDNRDHTNFIQECAKANERFCQAMEAAGYQRAIGTLVYNSTGSSR